MDISQEGHFEYAIRQNDNILITEDWDDQPFTNEQDARDELEGRTDGIPYNGVLVKRWVSDWTEVRTDA